MSDCNVTALFSPVTSPYSSILEILLHHSNDATSQIERRIWQALLRLAVKRCYAEGNHRIGLGTMEAEVALVRVGDTLAFHAEVSHAK